MWSGIQLAMLPSYVFWVLLLTVCAFAFACGRRDEQIAATACALATLVTHFILGPLKLKYATVEPGLLAVDVAMLATFVVLALHSPRFWPLWIAGLQLTMSMSHLMKAIDLQLMPRAYAAAAVFWSYPILLIILIGTWRQHRRRRRATLAAVPAG
jgi:hypothetical protein